MAKELKKDHRQPSAQVATPASGWVRFGEISSSAAKKFQAVLHSRWFIPGIVVVAIALRVFNLAAISQTPWFSHLQLDHQYYDQWAMRILAGDWLGEDVFVLDPLYAYFLAGVYFLFGHNLVAVLGIQLFLGIGICVLTALLGRRVFGPGIGNFACLIMALFIPGIFYESLIEKTTLSIFLATLSLFLFMGRSRRSLFLSGLVLGLACLTRANLLLFIPLGVLTILFEPQEGSSPGDTPKTEGLFRRMNALMRRLALWRSALFLLGVSVVLGSIMLRNAMVGGQWVLTTSNLGHNLYIGNRAGNDTGTYSAPPFVRPDPQFEENDFRVEAERRMGRQLTAKEISTYWRNQALEEMFQSPLRTVGLMLRKFRLFWHNFEIPDNGNIYLVENFSWVLRVPFFWMGAIFPFALLGGIAAFSQQRRARILSMISVVYCLVVIVFYVVSRYRIQIVPILAILASFGLAWLWNSWKSRNRKLLAGGATVIAAGLVFSLVMPESLRSMKTDSLAIGYNNLGALLLEAGDQGGAIAAYEQAILGNPKVAIGALRTLGDIYLAQGQYQRAEQLMLKVIDYKPDSRLGHEALIRLYERMQADENNRDDPEVQRKLSEARQWLKPKETQLANTADQKVPGSNLQSDSGDLSSTQSQKLIDSKAQVVFQKILSRESVDTPVWFATYEGDSAAIALQRELQAIFQRAGWKVRSNRMVSFRIKRGVFLLAADENPPPFVQTVHEALQAVGIKPVYGTGYRTYYEEMKRTNPAWKGFELDPNQLFILAVGPNPL